VGDQVSIIRIQESTSEGDQVIPVLLPSALPPYSILSFA
jgi:hypothetical protein